MNKLYCLSYLLLTIFVALNAVELKAQTTLTTTSTSPTSVTGNSQVVFGLRNTNNYPINLTDMSIYMPASHNATYTLWYHPTQVTGAPSATSTANGWIQTSATATVSNATVGIQPLFTNVGLQIPAGTTYRLAVVSTGGINYGGSGSSPDIFTAGGVELYAQANPNSPTYAGSFPGPPANTPRTFYGSVTFSPASPCVNPPTPGTVTSNVAAACSGSNFTLTLSGGTVGTGQTYQWESSADSVNFTAISGATNASYTGSQTTSTYYRAAVTCGGVTVRSASKLITTPALVSGTFTIDNTKPTGGSNFQSLNDAVNHIKCGINGPIVFNVASGTGPYTEQVTLPAIGGTSATNTITFNGNGATVSFNSTNGNLRAAFTLDGTDFVTIDSFVIEGSAGTFGWGIHLMNQANNNRITRNTINVLGTANTAYNYLGVVVGGSVTTPISATTAGNNNTISNNTITGGYYNIILYGNNAVPYSSGNVVTNNIVRDAYSYSIYSYGNINAVVSGNDISRPTKAATTTAGGVFLTTGSSGVLVEKNRIYNMFGALPTNTSTFYGIYVGGDAKAGQENKLINNLVYNINNNGALYGIYNTGGDSMHAYHNTIVLDDAATTSGATYGLYQTGVATGLRFQNNIVFINRAGTGTKRAIHFNTTTSTIVSNNNDLVMNSTTGTNNNLGQFGTVNYATLADWKTANNSAYDQQSVSVDPAFTNPGGGEFVPTANALDNLGSNVGVTTDILGNPRSSTTPDIGAYEFAGSGCTSPPTAGSAVAAPTGVVCSGSNFTLELANNTTGIGQTYQWQSSASATGPYTNISGVLTNPSFTTSATSTMFYRAIVTCNSISRTSDSIQVIINQGFAGGTYTINPAQPVSASNFQSFTQVADAIRCGILGPVVFNVAPGSGPYNEQITLPAITGTSATNTITINGNGATISFNSANSNQRAAITLDGTDFVTIDSLIIDGSAGTYGWGIQLMNQADNNRITRNRINVLNASTTAYNFLGVVVGGSITTPVTATAAGSNNLISGNTIIGGYYPVIMYGNSVAPFSNGNAVVNNIVQDAYSYSIYVYGNTNAVVSGNDISRPTKAASTTTAGVFLTTGTMGALVEKNRVHNMFDALPTSTSTFYGIYVGADAKPGQENKIINNLIYNINGNGAVYGIYNTGADSMQAYHNTIVVDDQAATSGSSYGLYQTGAASGVDFRNNMVYLHRSGTGTKRNIYLVTTTSGVTANNNNYYLDTSSGNNAIGQFGTTNYSRLGDWKTANGGAYDQQSFDFNPMFKNPSGADFTPTSSQIDNRGVAVGVTTDILNAPRNATTPDIGAFEFTTLTAGINMKAEQLFAPSAAANGCYTKSETVIITIRNSSTSTINFATNPVTVTTNVTGAVTQTLTTVLNSGTLASDSTINVTMSQPLNMSAPGTYVFNASTSVSGDVNTSNDAMVEVSRTKAAISAGNITASPISYCQAGGTPVLRTTGASGYGNLQWQQSSTPGSGFTNIAGGTTPTFQVPNAITQRTYYRLVATCDTSTRISAEVQVDLVNPQITSTRSDSLCTGGQVTLVATAAAGSTVRWYANATGGQPIATGDTLRTNITTTTTFYAAAHLPGGTFGASPLLITEMDLGETNDAFEIQNVSPSPLDVTGWRVAVSNSYSNINTVNATIMTLSGVMAPGDTKTWTDLATAPNYWGSNILWNPGQQGWAAILDANNNLVDIVFLGWPSSAIAASNITIGTTPINPTLIWNGNGVDVTNVASTHSVSRQGNLDNNTAADFAINPLSIGTLNPGMTIPFSGFGCTGSRTPVVALTGVTRWSGAGGTTAWENPTNWTCGSVPDMNVVVAIPAGATVVINSKAHAKSVSVAPGASLTVAAGSDLTVHQ
jgi:hypothetical protein